MTCAATVRRRIAEGLCTDCGSEPRPGKRTCTSCAAKRVEGNHRRKQEEPKLGFDRAPCAAEWEAIGKELGCSKQAAQQTAGRGLKKLFSREHYEQVQWRLRGALKRMKRYDGLGWVYEPMLREAVVEAVDLIGALEFLDALRDGSLEAELVDASDRASAWDRMMYGGRR